MRVKIIEFKNSNCEYNKIRRKPHCNIFNMLAPFSFINFNMNNFHLQFLYLMELPCQFSFHISRIQKNCMESFIHIISYLKSILFTEKHHTKYYI